MAFDLPPRSQGLKQSRPRQYLLLALTTLVASCTIIMIFSMRTASQDFSSPPVDSTASERITLLLVSNIAGTVNFIISDAIVVWRAWVMWHEERVAKTILASCTVAVVVLGVSSLALSCLSVLNPGYSPVNNNYMLCIPLLVMNVVATCAIGIRTWQHRREMRALLGSRRRRTPVERIMLLLFESGILYCSLWIVIILSGQGTLKPTVEKSILELAIVISALYPTLVVILVSLGKSQTETSVDLRSGMVTAQGMNDMERGLALDPIRFRVSHAHTTSFHVSGGDDVNDYCSSPILPVSSSTASIDLEKHG
ncbi:uncharacterized protein SCHCODRAFT_02249299 [Schizophyllum commune H4-8]|uniref:uncharacterized protein n=1 Tax=Schizophyllum commune (strain H4-8 / FGSC 9210) TaxID=578458 RepID=UPI0021602BC4|nr:uncharacterized protein SCHCODRAFT_02249299 [Schizophyllum commune H4-8]KAI5893293.1 hypothetical protein SCHCODRAFT_02249299 [Schizophyllum commune H4-8]